MKKYDELGIAYFNPMIDDWHPGLIVEENYFLNYAEVVLFPILKESLGTGSLGEIGFSIQNVLRNIQNGRQQSLIALIDDDCTDERKTQAERERSIKDRELVKTKFKKNVSCPIIQLCNTLDEMLELSLEMYEFFTQGCPQEETGTEPKSA
jgi:hypothetical protein